MAAASKLIHRRLGKDGPEVPRLGLGMVSMGGAYGTPRPAADRLVFLDEAYKRGETFWDTADEYGDCEEIIGQWLTANPDKRDRVTIATKFAIRKKEGADRGVSGFYVDSSPEYCRQAIEKSLGRLGVPSVDIYYVHRLDKITPIEKTMEAMIELKKARKIKHIGLSECSAESLRRAHKVHPVACVQLEYSPFCLAIESPQIRVLETARELGIGIVAYSPLGNGFITGAIRKREDFTKPGDLRAALPWLSEENLENNVAIVDKITDLANAKGISTAQLCLAWVLAQGDDVFPIPGTTNINRLEENLGSLSAALSPEEETRIRELAKGILGGRVQDKTPYTFADTPSL